MKLSKVKLSKMKLSCYKPSFLWPFYFVTALAAHGGQRHGKEKDERSQHVSLLGALEHVSLWGSQHVPLFGVLEHVSLFGGFKACFLSRL